MACVGLSQVKRRVYSINETSAASAIVKSALNITTTCDSYYQITNKRKKNPKVLINMDKLKICFIWLRTPHVFPLSNLKRIPSSTDKQWNTEPLTQMMNLKKWRLEKYHELPDEQRYLSQQIARSRSKWSTIAWSTVH